MLKDGDLNAGQWGGIEKVFSEFAKYVPIVSCSDNGLESLLGRGPHIPAS